MSTAGKKNAMQDAVRNARTGLPMREVRLLVPDVRHPDVIARTKAAIAALDPEDELESMLWIEAVTAPDHEDSDVE
jgi:hypothetical protein